MSRVRLVAAIGGVLVGLALAGSAIAASGSVKITETNSRYAFTPAKTFVNVGGSVTWTNTTDAQHTVTSDSGSELASSKLNQNGTFSHTFNAVGTVTYHCTIHDYMKGTIEVLAAGSTLPPTDTVASSTEPSQTAPVGLIPLLAFAVGMVVFGLRVRRRAA